MSDAARDETKPLCPNCGRPMPLVRIIPGIGGLAELRVYGCRQCGVSITEATERSELAGLCAVTAAAPPR